VTGFLLYPVKKAILYFYWYADPPTRRRGAQIGYKHTQRRIEEVD